MITAILIDDEKHCNQTLEIEIGRHCPDVKILGSYTSGKEGLAAIKSLQPNLVFLDIEMPWMNGFELLQKIEHLNFDVIFITAYDNYAIKAFRFSAIDYLLKPIQHQLLVSAIEKVKLKNNHNLPYEQLETLLHNMKNNTENNRVVFSTSEGLEIVEIKDIVRCQSDNNYTYIYLSSGEHIFLSKTLKEVEQMIQSSTFIRVHQSHLVNINFIKRFVKGDGGYLLLKDDKQVSVSKSRREQLMHRIGNM